MKLKTLKDLERFEDLKHQDHFIVSSAVLKSEAVKIKEIGKRDPLHILMEVFEIDNPSVGTETIYGIDKEKAMFIIGKFLNWFFNLTKEDLK